MKITFPRSVAFPFFCERHRAWDCEFRVSPTPPNWNLQFRRRVRASRAISCDDAEEATFKSGNQFCATRVQIWEQILRHSRSNVGTNFGRPAFQSGNQFCAIHVQIQERILRHSRSNLGTEFVPFTLKSGNQFCMVVRLVGLPNPFLSFLRAPCAQTRFIFDGVGSWAGGGIILHGGLLLARGPRNTVKISAEE